MRAGKNGSPDEILRERCLGEIAPLLAAAKSIDSLSPAQKQQVRRRIVRTLFRAHPIRVRFRLAPVLVGVGLLVAGGVAFATAERLGLIRRAVDAPAPADAFSKATSAESHKHRAGRPIHAVRPAAAEMREESSGETGAVKPAVVLPDIPTPLLDGAAPSRTWVWAPIAPVSAPPTTAALAPIGRAVPSLTSSRASVVASADRPRAATRKLALGTPYLAEPVGAIAQGSALRPISFGAEPPPASPVLPTVPEARATLAPAAATPVPSPSARPEGELFPRHTTSDPALFGQALRKLRNEGNPAAALSLLQEHAQAYPHSVLGGERSSLEVEALLALHRDREALQRLDDMALDRLPRSGERFVVRGELRAGARRWREAEADFDKALASKSGSPAWHERALWGRAVARLRYGDQEDGLADVKRYRDMYPKGRFAAEAAKFFMNR